MEIRKDESDFKPLVKTIAFYLPQYHRIPENDEWWGDGFTEWTNIKKAKPLFDGHYQPRIPLDFNYYNLLDSSVQEWQSNLAQKFGIYGFCYYHYWFDGHMLLEKPAENMLLNPNVTIPFCFCWANEDWTKAWVSKKNTVLISQNYGDEKEWIKHFLYFLPFFKDERYIKENNKPFFIFYRPELIDRIEDMMKCWERQAIKYGFDGMVFAFQSRSYSLSKSYKPDLFDYEIEYQPGYSGFDTYHRFSAIRKVKRSISLFLEKKCHIDSRFIFDNSLSFSDYDKVWSSICAHKPSSPKAIAGAFVDWDNTPRRGNKGSVCLHSTPEKFGKYMTQQVRNVKANYSNDYLFLFAWNEWAEGGYLEPDEKYHYAYLEALRKAVFQ